MATLIDPSIIGRTGGQSKSPAKQAAVRLNGTKGGRPRKVKHHCSVCQRMLVSYCPIHPDATVDSVA